MLARWLQRQWFAQRRLSPALWLLAPLAGVYSALAAVNRRRARPERLPVRVIVARDLAHAKIRERLERQEPMPDYFKNHPVYYAGPAKTPAGYASAARSVDVKTCQCRSCWRWLRGNCNDP